MMWVCGWVDVRVGVGGVLDWCGGGGLGWCGGGGWVL